MSARPNRTDARKAESTPPDRDESRGGNKGTMQPENKKGKAPDSFRSRHARNSVYGRIKDACRKMHASAVPAFILLTGTAFASTIPLSTTGSATVVFVTGALALLFAFMQPSVIRAHRKKMREIGKRFEALEDRAWELRESEERYRSLVEAFGDIWVACNSDGKITECNDAFASVRNKSSDELIGHALPDFIARKLASNNRELEVPFETRLRTPSGIRWYAWLQIPMRDVDSGNRVTIAVGREITRHKQAERLEKRARERAEAESDLKSQFIAMASHEMRTPLNGILGITKLLRGTRLDPEQKNYAEAIENSGSNLLALISNMLDLTAIEAGHFNTREEPFDTLPLFEETIELLSTRAYENGLDIGLVMENPMPESLVGDAQRIRQMLLNIAGNAIKYTAEGGVLIEGKWQDDVCDNTRGVLTVLISDTGPGLSKADRERVFSAFERANDTARQVEGAGLGLAITKALAREMGGTVRLAETGSEGSVFELTLPFAKADPDKNLFAPRITLETVTAAILSNNTREAVALQTSLQARNIGTELYRDKARLLQHLSSRETESTVIFFDPVGWRDADEIAKALNEGLRAGDRIVMLLNPSQRKPFAKQIKAYGFFWLTRPIRQTSLNRLLASLSKETDIQPLVDFKEGPTCNVITSHHQEPTSAGRVLLAEDNDINALLASSALLKAGYEVVRAHDGQEAFDAYEPRTTGSAEDGRGFDIILMDMHMPRCNGIEAIKKIRAAEAASGLSAVPIVVLTADGQPTTRSRLIAAGANEMVEKPVDPGKLVETVCDFSLVAVD